MLARSARKPNFTGWALDVHALPSSGPFGQKISEFLLIMQVFLISMNV